MPTETIGVGSVELELQEGVSSWAWVLGTEFAFYAREARYLNSWAVSPDPGRGS